ncbi:MAG: molecular chaperone DnaJ [Anaerolineae bacterium]|nr:molecular chaperone DnaJ [Anaerolineae bacterium]MDW8172366.1 molecular chaperone DnaJ [Anaerolineae bacterium]
MMARDYYEVLGVTRNASKDDIKKAFRNLARKYHPDVSREADAEQRFKEINEAYEVLADDDKRARYDRFGHAGVQGQAGGAPTGFGGFEEIFEEFFSNFVGGRGASGARRGPQRGGDVRVDVVLDFIEAAFGVEREVDYYRLELCDICHGSGAATGSMPTTCPECRGTGQVQRVTQTFVGSVVRVTTCPRCSGRGTVITNPCRACDGNGKRRKKTTLPVKIPAGVSDGMRIQVRGEGDAGDLNAPMGDLYVVVQVREHEVFKRRDYDVVVDWTINVAQAALGDKIQVPTIDGDVELVIPPGTQTGSVFRLKGKGLPRLRSDGTHSGRGNQEVYVQVVIPERLTERQRKLFEELAESFGKSVAPQQSGRGFFARMMDFMNGQSGDN